MMKFHQTAVFTVKKNVTQVMYHHALLEAPPELPGRNRWNPFMWWKILLVIVVCLHKGHCFSLGTSRGFTLESHKLCTITGVEVVYCRSFSVNEPKLFSLCGSYCDIKKMPAGVYPEIAFVGRSNVGKSSLLNTLTGQRKKVAIESSTPGTTKLINLYECKTNSGPLCYFADLPGYGYAKLSQKIKAEISAFARDYLLARKSLKLVVLLLDARREPNNEDQELLQFLLESGLRVVVAATKSDKLPKGEISSVPNRMRNFLTPASPAPEPVNLSSLPVVPVSSVTGDGRMELWRVIRGSLLAEE